MGKTLMLGQIESRKRRGQQRMSHLCWMASPTHWTWVWASSRGWWWTGKPGVLQSMGLQRVRHDWVTKQKQLEVRGQRLTQAVQILNRLMSKSEYHQFISSREKRDFWESQNLASMGGRPRYKRNELFSSAACLVSKDFMPERSRMILMARVGELWSPDTPGVSRARLSSRADVSVSQKGPLALNSTGKTLTNHCSLGSPSLRRCTDHPPLANTIVSQTRHVVINNISQLIRFPHQRCWTPLGMDSSY